MQKIVIIGNGISGITCARNIRKNCDDEITVISGETEHFFSRTALMYIYMGHMKYEHTKPYEDFFWTKNRITLLKEYVSRVDTQEKTLLTRDNKTIPFDILIIASGSVTKKFNWPGQDLKGVISLYSYQDLQEIEERTKNIGNAVIVGGGLIGIELAEMLHSRRIEVTMLVKEKYYWNSILPQTDAELVGSHIEKHSIKVLYETGLKDIIGDSNGNVHAIITTKGETIPCPVIGITTGVTPNINFLANSGIETDKGILINKFFETNIEDVYAIGDCAQFRESVNGRKTIEQVWYTGRMHGETLAQTIAGSKTAYNPGPWFNSAKFLDLEYQTYGTVLSKLRDDETCFHWKHPKKEIAFTAVYNSSTKQFIGVNTFSLKLRHECLDRWLKDTTTIDFVLSNLNAAFFDKEFSANHTAEIVHSYNEQTGAAVPLKLKRSFFSFIDIK
ncbi:MAG: FAD-dependent oxidoreductase [Bacteroidota bacterium]